MRVASALNTRLLDGALHTVSPEYFVLVSWSLGPRVVGMAGPVVLRAPSEHQLSPLKHGQQAGHTAGVGAQILGL